MNTFFGWCCGQNDPFPVFSRHILRFVSASKPTCEPPRHGVTSGIPSESAGQHSKIVMKAAYIKQTGPPEVIIYGELPRPQPGASECLVQVAAVDVNPIDVYIRAGMIPAKLNFPYIIGRDLAGTVIETGPKVKQFKTGDRVWVTGQGVGERQGTFSEFAAVDER